MDERAGRFPTKRRSSTGSSMDKKRDAREANRIHCRQTRERNREKERLLKEEVEVLTLYKAIVEDGPDLFSCHRVELDAPFRCLIFSPQGREVLLLSFSSATPRHAYKFNFLCENYYTRLQVAPEEVLGQPLASIVDPRDVYQLRGAVCQILDQASGGGSSAGGGGTSGTMVHLRVVCGGLTFPASMTMVIGSQGMIVVTRLYDV